MHVHLNSQHDLGSQTTKYSSGSSNDIEEHNTQKAAIRTRDETIQSGETRQDRGGCERGYEGWVINVYTNTDDDCNETGGGTDTTKDTSENANTGLARNTAGLGGSTGTGRERASQRRREADDTSAEKDHESPESRR